MKCYGTIAKPLTTLLKKDGFLWNAEADEAFQRLKLAMSNTPVLALPDFTKPFVIETDACYGGVGAVLIQDKRPLAYLSQSLGPENLGLSIYEKELLALVMAVVKWRHYLEGHHFIIRTDHQSLKYLLDQRVTTTLQQKWLTKLLGLSYEIQYKKGRENVVADALSRRASSEEGDCTALVCVIPEWIQEVIGSYKGDTQTQDLIRQLLLAPDSQPDFTYQDGVVRYKGRILVGSEGNVRRKIIAAVHDSQLGGHSGIQASYLRAKQLFHWPGMHRDIKDTILQCDTCRKCKNEHTAYPGLLQPLPIPQYSWSHVTMDFIEGLPMSERRDTIMVVVDRFTKLAHFISLSHPFDAPAVARLFLDHICKLHGFL